jgi:hypothetical protein
LVSDFKGRIFGPRRDVVIQGWRRLHNEELHNLYSLQNIIRMIKPRRMRWAGHVALTEMKRNECIHDFCGNVRRKETTRKT